MKETLRIINQMKADGVIEKYAIGGAVGASIYLEPFTTKDLDIFVNLPIATETKLISLTAIYDYLLSRGCTAEGQFVLIADWMVEFLPAGSDLERDAIENAVRFEIEGVETRVMTPEHLAAICLQTGRTKDRYRLLAFIEQQAVNLPKLHLLVEKYGLKSEWDNFEKRDLRPSADRTQGTTKDDRRRYLRQLSVTKKVGVIEELRNAGQSLRKARRMDG